MFRRHSHIAQENLEMASGLHLQKKLNDLGLQLDLATGHLFYLPEFKPFNVSFELLFIRHGETFGNCGQTTSTGDIDQKMVISGLKNIDQRIYQGDVDKKINQLTENGKQQALNAAAKITNEYVLNDWIPDTILISPLSRARETALPFINSNNFKDRCVIDESIKEMSFGSWDNKRVCDLPPTNVCHSFYREQNSLVKSPANDARNHHVLAENFCDVLLRAFNVLSKLSLEYPDKKIIMFSHSMFGAACCILLGHGQKFEESDHLAFDGKRKDGSYYTMPNATPFPLNFQPPMLRAMTPLKK